MSESGWIEVANVSDPGEGRMRSHDPGRLNPGQEYWYRLESCNRINCSGRPVEVKVKVQGKIFNCLSLYDIHSGGIQFAN
jgi:hypothetical protein